MSPFFEALGGLWLFLLVMVGSPGPANMLALSAGARAGLRPVLPFICGLVAGKLLLNMLLGVGLLSLMTLYPQTVQLASWAAAGWLIWLALQGWSGPSRTGAAASLPGFWQALPVHPLNPKAWVMLLLAWTEFGPQLGGPEVQWLVIPASFAGFQLVFHSLWALGGAGLGRYWQDSVLLHRALSLLTIAVILWAVLLA